MEGALGPGMYKCEFCGIVDDRDKFMPPSKRWAWQACCRDKLSALRVQILPLPLPSPKGFAV